MEDVSRRVFGDSTITINNTTTRQIKGSLITHPDVLTWAFAFLSPWSWRRKVNRDIHDMVDVSRVMVRRMPTQDEVDAIVQHSSRRTYMSRVGILPGFTVWWVWSANDVMKSGLVDPLLKLRGRNWGMDEFKDVVRQVRERAAAQPVVSRSLVVSTLTRFFFLIPIAWSFGSAYAASAQTKNMLGDERLGDFMKEMKGQSPDVLKQRRVEVANEIFRRRAGEKQPQQQPEGADATLGQEPGFYDSSEQDQMSSMDSTASAGAVNGDKPQAQAQPERDLKQFSEPPRQSTSQSGSGDFFDDASPIASEYKNEGPNQPLQGSAWERIRQQNVATGGPPVRQDNFPGRSHVEERNSSTDYASEKERDREQARVEFERLMESERNMSTDSPYGESRGWGSR